MKDDVEDAEFEVVSDPREGAYEPPATKGKWIFPPQFWPMMMLAGGGAVIVVAAVLAGR